MKSVLSQDQSQGVIADEQDRPQAFAQVGGQQPVSSVGTSVNGGYGIDPVATEAELFVADPATGDVLHSQVPVPGGRAVNGLTFGDDGTLWGVSDGTLFTYDPDPRAVTRAELLFRNDGYLYATSSGSLWRVEPGNGTTARRPTARAGNRAVTELRPQLVCDMTVTGPVAGRCREA